MTIVVVQCRLNSSRLPEKALFPLGGKSLLDWTLCAMRRVSADGYWLATDADSAPSLAPVAERNGFGVFAGPLDDVLERFCQVIRQTGADTVVRATADNPFLFYEAAQALVEEYGRRRQTGACDYITFTGLPHGSGVEMFDAHALLTAAAQTDSPYDHEHVGPALYNHAETWRCVFADAPVCFRHPALRTTVDTAADYRRACALVRAVSGRDGSEADPVTEPYTAEQIVGAFADPSVARPVLCVPSVRKGRGTGHLRRCLAIALACVADVYIPRDADLERAEELLAQAKADGLADWQVTHELPQEGDYALVVTDAFALDRAFALRLAAAAPIAAIDEGSLNTDLCDFLFDIIPSYGIARPANVSEPSYITLPQHRRELPPVATADDIRTVLVTVGGEDPADLVVPAAMAFAACRKQVTAIVQCPEAAASRVAAGNPALEDAVAFIAPVHNLRERLADYDVVVTHYGFTAFEAVAAGCGVILLGTSPLHIQLAQKYGFACLAPSDLNEHTAQDALANVVALYPDIPFAHGGGGKKSLGGLITALSGGRRFACPVCRKTALETGDSIVARTAKHTFRRCQSCGMLYMSWTAVAGNTAYDVSYFFDDYKNQYGKTYLDDFTAIKSQCVRRTSIVDALYRNAHKAVTPTVLDVGCAYGPYLDAANDAGWQVYGTDIAPEAVAYVQEHLHYPAAVAQFPAFDPVAEFGIPVFDAVTMWYVIEHFHDLDAVLRGVSKMLKPGGIFAFSTPSASGVSAKFSPQKFFAQSPDDHYTLWEPARAASVLRPYGFKVVKIVSTGHHPERFPQLSARKGQKISSFKVSLFTAASHFFALGDTFEIYCKKERDI